MNLGRHATLLGEVAWRTNIIFFHIVSQKAKLALVLLLLHFVKYSYTGDDRRYDINSCVTVYVVLPPEEVSFSLRGAPWRSRGSSPYRRTTLLHPQLQ